VPSEAEASRPRHGGVFPRRRVSNFQMNGSLGFTFYFVVVLLLLVLVLVLVVVRIDVSQIKAF
jgi:hypothetical protein